MSEPTECGLSNPTLHQLKDFFQDEDLLADFLLKYGGWRVSVPKTKPSDKRRRRMGSFSIYRLAPEDVADRFREQWPGYLCPIPKCNSFLLSHLIKSGKSDFEIVQTLRITLGTLKANKARHRLRASDTGLSSR